MYDVIIIGAGPAGMTAAIYTARRKLNTLVLAKDVGGQMIYSADVENYTGFTMVTGAELTLKFQEHMASLKEDLKVELGVEVAKLEKNITSFAVEDTKGNVYYAKTVIIASGKLPRHLGVPGEQELFGKGIAICATCDGPLYREKNVAVVGAGNSAMDAICALSKVAKQVYVINMSDDYTGEAIVKDKIMHIPNVKSYHQAKVVKVSGKDHVEGITIQQLGKPDEDLAVSGVFIEIGYEPSISFADIVDKNEHNEIKVDKDLQTSVPGIFAAGDINDAWGEQIIIAAGEGAKAAMAVSNYLTKLK
ncbi:MAG TPA: FAD-dependent oxidoreductase [Patescibacteria group bacterium]|jgi:alkyl hydroperoxide reductase subunit F|nr:FAD-dependent oxidoreductase [Patescibacteria group bacterium]